MLRQFRWTLLLVLFIVSGCEPTRPSEPTNLTADPSLNPNTVTIFLTGNTLSTLKPCGCSTGQLGGLDRRGAVIHSTPADRRLLIDTGNFLAQDTPQDRLKLSILLQALTLQEYDILHLDKNDLQVITEMGLLDSTNSKLFTSNPNDKIPANVEREFALAGRKLLVTIASLQAADFNSSKLSQLFDAKGDTAKSNLLILDSSDPKIIDSIAKTNLVDVLIVPATATEPRIVDRGRTRPLVVSVGKFGEYAAKLTLEVQNDGSVKPAFTEVPITDKLLSDKNLVDLYKFYQTLVHDEKILDKVPQVPLEGGLAYVGTSKCKTCHEFAYQKWTERKHAIAYPTLVKFEHQYDPECVKCHVIGLGYESGFKNDSSPEELRNVGCEACHGPGNKHIESVLTQKPYVALGGQPRMKCVDCHTNENSSGFAGHEREYFQKIVHWKEPKAEDSIQYLSGTAAPKADSVNVGKESSDNR
jgi:hypothetical protein